MIKRCELCGADISLSIDAYHSELTDTYICDDCIRKCRKASLQLEQEREAKEYRETKQHRAVKKMMPPVRMKEELDKTIIGQERAKIVISTAVYNHYKRQQIESQVKLSKNNILLIGPTGCGKTLIVQTVAELLNVPFAVADCNSFTEAGYVGEDVESVLTKLLRAADGSIEEAEHGIVFLDEIDKLASFRLSSGSSRDVSGEGVQQALLKMIEGTVATVPKFGTRKTPNAKSIQMNTENILFICGGAFVGLEKIINKRIMTANTGIGFGATVEKQKEKSVSEAFRNVSTEDLEKFGMIPELLGRIPVVVALEELDTDAMLDILTKPENSLVRQYEEIFRYDGIELEFEPEVLQEIAQETIKRKTGARGLSSIMEELLQDAMFRLPSEPDVEKCIVKKGGELEIVRTEEEQLAF